MMPFHSRKDFVTAGVVTDRLKQKHKPTSFLICPVRGVDPETQRGIVEKLEAEGFKVHWPARDTDQNDPDGYRICSDNLAAIRGADVVHVIWDGKSQGCLFDLGMAFALYKYIIPVELPPRSEGKSFQNMIRAYAALLGQEEA